MHFDSLAVNTLVIVWHCMLDVCIHAKYQFLPLTHFRTHQAAVCSQYSFTMAFGVSSEFLELLLVLFHGSITFCTVYVMFISRVLVLVNRTKQHSHAFNAEIGVVSI